MNEIKLLIKKKIDKFDKLETEFGNLRDEDLNTYFGNADNVNKIFELIETMQREDSKECDKMMNILQSSLKSDVINEDQGEVVKKRRNQASKKRKPSIRM